MRKVGEKVSVVLPPPCKITPESGGRSDRFLERYSSAS